MRRLAYFITGASLGAFVGSILALLYAPEPGAAVREDVQARVRQFWEEVRRAGEQERRRLEEELIILRRGASPEA